MRLHTAFIASTLIALAASTSAAQQRGAATQPAPAAARPAAAPVLIKNATVMTASHGTLENTDILMRGGKIAAIGSNLAAPAGGRTIDAAGKFVIPGIIDAHSHSMADAINEGT